MKNLFREHDTLVHKVSGRTMSVIMTPCGFRNSARHQDIEVCKDNYLLIEKYCATRMSLPKAMVEDGRYLREKQGV